MSAEKTNEPVGNATETHVGARTNVEPQCERVTVIDTYEVCDQKDGEIYIWCDDNVVRPARRVKRVISPRNRGVVELE